MTASSGIVMPILWILICSSHSYTGDFFRPGRFGFLWAGERMRFLKQFNYHSLGLRSTGPDQQFRMAGAIVGALLPRGRQAAGGSEAKGGVAGRAAGPSDRPSQGEGQAKPNSGGGRTHGGKEG